MWRDEGFETQGNQSIDFDQYLRTGGTLMSREAEFSVTKDQ